MLDCLCDHPKLIDEYLEADGCFLSAEDKATLAGWKSVVRERFFLERILKSGGVLLSRTEPGVGYLVKTFMLSWEDQDRMAGVRVPAVMRACLLPYDGVIVTDGTTHFEPALLGPGIARSLKEEYMEAKRAGRIRRTL